MFEMWNRARARAHVIHLYLRRLLHSVDLLIWFNLPDLLTFMFNGGTPQPKISDF